MLLKQKSIFFNKKYYLLITSFILIFFGCISDKKEKHQKKSEPPVLFSVTAASDTIALDEYAKIFAKLKRPYFSDVNSEIMVFMESNDSFPLKPDLSNEYDVDIAVFLNLKHDTLNQKWVRNMDNSKTVVFGRKFNRTGKDTVRGYIMEYVGNTPPIDDQALDSIQVKKYYFEKEIYIRGNGESDN